MEHLRVSRHFNNLSLVFRNEDIHVTVVCVNTQYIQDVCPTASFFYLVYWFKTNFEALHRNVQIKCTQHYNTLFIHHTYLFFISKVHMIADLYTNNCIDYILCFCYFVHCLFVYCSFVVCVLSCNWHSVALWSFCHCNIFLVCVNIPGQ